jgi:hypothetical protein
MFTLKTRPKFNIKVKKNEQICFPSFHAKRRCHIPSYLFVDFVNHRKMLVMFRNASQ